MVGWALDSMNSGLISGTLPLIIRDLGLSPEVAGRVLSAWLAGMLVGGFTMGFLSDKLGRKAVIMLTLALMGAFSYLSSLAAGWLDLTVLRFLAGLGASGYMVVASTLLSEYSPTGVRGGMVAVLESSWALGWLLSLVLARVIAPYMGWRPVMQASAATLFYIPLLALLLPESARFLAAKGRLD